GADLAHRRPAGVRRHRCVLLQNRGGYLRRRVLGAGICRPGSGRTLPLAEARRNARRPRHGGDDARATDHGAAIRRLHGGVPGSLSPLLAGTLGGLLAPWVTFIPCFLWIFAGAPFVEALRGNKALNAALSCITAAVVGVVLNLAVWFALHALFHQVWKVPGLA